MPLRRRDRKPSKNVTLHQALNWIAFDSFDGPSLVAAEVAAQIFGYVDDVEQIEIAEFSRQQSLEVAEEDLFAALRDGDIQAHGRFSDHYAHNSHENEWTKQAYEDHSETRSEIPAEFWCREGVSWERNSTKSPHGEYVDIILDRAEVLSLWTTEEAETEGDSEQALDSASDRLGQKRGPKELYSETEFLALCFWEVAVNDLLEPRSKFVNRMAEICAVVWGEDKTPGDTWLKSKIKYLYDLKEKYERGRRLLEGGEISDRNESRR